VLSKNGWTVVTSELGYVPKQFPELTDAQRAESVNFCRRSTITTTCIASGRR